jgi:hypothetical protein
VAISLWENREHAEAYVRELYPKVEKIVQKYTDGTPIVRNLDTEYSTFHEVAFAAGSRQEGVQLCRPQL